MPELPEVEIMAGNARRWSLGRVVEGVDVADGRVCRGGEDGWVDGVWGGPLDG
ncbi:MAG: DNA-formamidopyrimidine glycosylase, partial [Deltaproteobacteria bacterium]